MQPRLLFGRVPTIRILHQMTGTNRYLIGIAGGSGSGKTSFIQQIRNMFSEEEVCILSLDNYYKPREHQQIDEKGIRNFDRPESIDIDRFIEDLHKLRAGDEVVIQEYTFNNILATPKELRFLPAPVIIVEGLFIYHFPELRKLFDLKCFVEADDILKLIRRIQRDQLERNYPLDDVLYRYQFHVKPSYEQYILPYQKEVDLIINNHQSFQQALDMFRIYIRHLVGEAVARTSI